MSVPMHMPPWNARVVEVIEVEAHRGSRTSSDPERLVTLYFSREGKMLACYDPLNGPPDNWLEPEKLGWAKTPEGQQPFLNKIVAYHRAARERFASDEEAWCHCISSALFDLFPRPPAADPDVKMMTREEWETNGGLS